MDTVVFLLHIRGLKPLHYISILFSREENFAGGKFREIPFGVDIIFAGGKFRAKSKFANIAKISSTRKIGVIQYCNNRHFKSKGCCRTGGYGKQSAKFLNTTFTRKIFGSTNDLDVPASFQTMYFKKNTGSGT